MKLPDCLIWALEGANISKVKIFCDKEIRENVSSYFTEQFTEEWENALKLVEEHYDSEVSDEWVPASSSVTEFGVYITISTIAIGYCYDDFYDLMYGSIALDDALKAVKEKYPEIKYEGYIAFPWSDCLAGDVYQDEISSESEKEEKEKVFDFVGIELDKILSFESHDETLAEEKEADDLDFVITGELKYIENRQVLIEYIKIIGASVSESVSDRTDYLINNDRHSKSSKNVKAKELGIPLLSEVDFIIRFGNPDKFAMNLSAADFWERLSNQLVEGDANLSEYKEVMIALYAHSKWITKQNLNRSVNTLIDMALKNDSECREELVLFAKKLEEKELAKVNP